MTFLRLSLRHLPLLVVGFLLLCRTTAVGQQAARPERGTMVNRTYSLSDIERISIENGNVNLSIPLASLPPIAGGKLSWTISANYNSKLWNTLREQADYPNDMSWNPYVVSLPSLGGGWQIGGQYVMQIRSSNEDFSRLVYPSNSGLPSWELSLLNNHSYWKVVLLTPDGAEHEFRPIDHSPYGGTQDFLRGYFNVLPGGTAVRYYSVDGTYMFASISDQWNWTVYMPDGTRVIQTGSIQRIQDTNGNKIKIFSDANGTHYQDEQTGREIRTTYDPAANGGAGQTRVWYSTVTGIQHHIDINFGTTSVQGKNYFVSDWDPDGGESFGIECQKSAVLQTQLSVIREIVLPQTEPTQPQQRFTFSYNSDTTESASNPARWNCDAGFTTYTRQASRGWGELSRMVTPSGSIVDYAYTLDSAHLLLGPLDDLSMQSIAEKKVTHDGTVDTWTYSVSESGGSVTSPDGNNVAELKHCTSTGCATGKAGLAYRTMRPFMITERHWTSLTFSGANTDSPGGNLTFNPVVDFEYTTLLDASNNPLKMSAKAFQYDYNGNVTQTTEYDWFDPALVSRDAQGVPTGVPASATVLRVSSNSYYNQASGSTSANVYAKRSVSTGAPLILNATQQTTVGPAIAQFSYDGQGYGVAPTAGNLTTKKAWDDLDNKWITTSNTYDVYGNVATATDARGKVTQFFYEDATHALPTRVVVDPQNGTGTQTSLTGYDYSTGLVISQTDANGQLANIEYFNHLLGAIDPFGRPGTTKSPAISINGTTHRRQVKTTYLDTTRKVIVEADLNAENDKLLKTRTTTDMLGRPILSESTEDGTNYTISVRNLYLDMGRVTLTSSPMRSTAAPTDSWTRVTNDNAGRVSEVATFGGATQPAWSGTAGAFTGAVNTVYVANFTTVTDQAGKVRRSMTDAFGRLVRVDEPDANGNLGSTTSPVQKTDYEYDVFGNLKKVIQGTQQRTFTYDSLSRLRTAINPESGTVTYQYDDNGNLLVKTDARGVSTHYDYDSLNRVTRRWYNGSSSTSQLTHNVPALPSGVGATDEVKFYYDSQALPSGAPSYARGSAVGRLVAQTYGSGSAGDYYAYDVLGRQNLKIQQTGGVNYQLTAGYTLAGAVSSLAYPSGHTISNTFDQAGRLTSFSGNLGDGTTRTYSTGSVYSAIGSLLKEQFGTSTPVYHKLHYNSRAQLCDVRASNVNDEWGGELGALKNFYSTPFSHCSDGSNNNGNVLMSQTIVNSSVYFEDRYSYDSLNRLTAVNEYLNGTSFSGKQEYDYDRWGNRTLKSTSTLGLYKQFTVNTANNRLGVPSGQTASMTYDDAGNLINDTYTGAGTRTYDGENKITSAWGGNNQAQLYGYDASGQRIKRTVDGVQTWQVYGFGGELLAEYPANGAPTSPQKEYGYRNGQLLIVAESGPSGSGGSPYGGTAAAIPGVIQAENYDNGGEGIGYHDTTPGTHGQDYDQPPNYPPPGFRQPTDVDIYKYTGYSNGYLVLGQAGDWTNYTVNVSTAGSYTLQAQVAWGGTNGSLGSFHVEVDGVDKTGPLQIPDTGWELTTVTKTGVQLSAGTHLLRIVWDTNAGNGLAGDIDYLNFTLTEAGSSFASIQWLVPDHLGTPRMIIDQTGTAANVKRHDYLPFGEEISDGTGGRTTAMGYVAGDGVRQQFTSKERDLETGLDYFEARYYAGAQGRFTSIDPYNIVMERQYATNAKKAESQFTSYLSNPQRWARYTYALNNPLLYTDPHGEDVTIYYRPPKDGAGSKEDYGHILIYVRNDETGESAYFDYIATGDYNNLGATQLNGVDQGRIDAHASITIETNASQEQAIVDGIKSMQQSSPDYSVSPTSAITHSESTCTSQSIRLLALGGINVGPTLAPQTPTAVWQSAFKQYGDFQGNRGYLPSPNPMFPNMVPITNGYNNAPQVDPKGREYGRDPRGQARVLDRNATNNVTMTFRGGKRVQ